MICAIDVQGATVLRSLASQLGDGTAREYEALAEVHAQARGSLGFGIGFGSGYVRGLSELLVSI